MNNRPSKIVRLSYWNKDPNLAAQFSLFGNPSEARMSASGTSFISVRTDGISLAPGIGGSVNIQGLSQNLKYAGLLSDLPFPMSLIPSTAVTPLPKQMVVPPLGGIMSMIRDLSSLSSLLVGL